MIKMKYQTQIYGCNLVLIMVVIMV